MLLLAPGPVPISPELAEVARIAHTPYFRGDVFARLMLDLTADLRLVFRTTATPLTVTSSGTGLMEMAIVNLLNPGDRVLVVNGGTFGLKWVRMCRSFGVDAAEFRVPLGRSPDLDALADSVPANARALLVNAHETSTGSLYDLPAIGEIARRKGLLYIVDGVSSIGADEYRMDDWGIDCSMVSTQKALGCMPGLGFIAFSERARQIIPGVRQPRCYFDAPDYENNLPRGMVPFTPAVYAILQIRRQLDTIKTVGIDGFVERHRRRARAFRDAILADPRFGLFPERPSNAISTVTLPPGVGSTRLVRHFQREHDWWFATNPTGNEGFLRVSHMGDVGTELLRTVAGRIHEAVDLLLASPPEPGANSAGAR
jgi:aspartate aminotransferase-like enzyme